MSAPLLVDAAWLAQHIQDPGLVIVDVRPSSDYAKGHIPGAITWDTFLKYHWADTSPEGMALLVQVLGHTLGRLGIGNDTRVVTYGEILDHQATRGLWVLRWLGNDQASALDGGLKAWQAAGGALSTEPRRLAPVSFTPRPNPADVATADEIVANLESPSQFVLDTRTPEEYAGTNLRATRGGHIPGSVNLPFQKNLTEAGTLKPLEELRAQYGALGFRPDQDVVTVCHGGYRSAHTWMVLKLLGHDRVRSYVGSWQEWGDRIDLPIETPEA